ncbi:LysM peptidoglycan-binding domain-containing protein [Desulfosarcina cetonica]|uniref:LysM peptidoglycan-binding domain-containing protein n=1 Tax=Desulfosarcina cetonica TaxID=90730 RepID=UPI0006D29D1F|nr:LysM domain-containing protein [Desulfosarcina cetonica]
MPMKRREAGNAIPTHGRMLLLALLILLLPAANTLGAVLYKDYVVRFDRGWDILCDPYEVKEGDWVLKIFRQKGELAHQDFREFLDIFRRLNPHVQDIDLLRPGQVVDIPLKKLSPGALPGQSSGMVTIPFVMLSNPKELIKKHLDAYTVQKGDSISRLVATHFGGRFGSPTFNEGLKLFKAANPQIKDLNRIYAGQRIYMPDPSIREQSWYEGLFDKAGNIVDNIAQPVAGDAPSKPVTKSVPIPTAAPSAETTPEQGGPYAEAASMIGGRLMDKGTLYLPMQKGEAFELDLSRFPVIDLLNQTQVILTTQERVMDVDLPVIRTYWKDVKAVKIPEGASAREIVQSILAALDKGDDTNRLAFDDNGVTISVSAKWIRSEPSEDGHVTRHTCITPITSPAQETHAGIRRYLAQNDILIKDLLLNGVPDPSLPAPLEDPPAVVEQIDGRNQKVLIAAFARRMGFQYSPDTRISFPYAGIQVQAFSNLVSFGNGREMLIDFGELYGDAIQAIRDTGLSIVQIPAGAGALALIGQLLDSAGISYTRDPVFYAANRPPDYNTALTVHGLLVPSRRGETLLFIESDLPPLIGAFIRGQGVRPILIRGTENG